MKGRIVVFEGVDASGKATQAKLFFERIKKAGKKAELSSFPRYNEFFGSLVGRYLAGEFGSKEELPPEFCSLLYSLDRYHAKKEIQEKLKKGTILVFDRYFTANYGFQPAKFKGKKQREEFFQWMKALESRMPQPDLVFFLDVLPQISRKLMKGKDREKAYRKGRKKDIYESDIAYQNKVRAMFLHLCRKEKNWSRINCVRGNKLKSREEIHSEVWKKAQKILK
ncbi:MAG: dTMP kinase [Candidatus Diapherotrites archaeon]